MSESFLNGKVELRCGDCLEVLQTLPDNSIDSCVTDPPYHLTSIINRFGKANSAPAQFGSDGRFMRASAGFMGKQWDGGDIAFRPEVWAQVLRVLKPGAHLLAFGGTRTYHRMACAIEDAGFEIRDQIQWLYGSGFPKSHDVSKGIDRAAGKNGTLGDYRSKDHAVKRKPHQERSHEGYHRPWQNDPVAVDATLREYIPATDAARQWEGWGTALKPANEPICLARKPLSESTVAANVLKWGTGAINVGGCRVPTSEPQEERARNNGPTMGYHGCNVAFSPQGSPLGRWPANVIHDGRRGTGGIWQESSGVPCGPQYGDSGSAARFFYTAKADADDRLGSKHPTVKPLDLMQYLVRLVTPKGGTALDCFSGTGTTGEAAWREGVKAVLIEREAEYQADIRRRMALCLAGPDERTREAIKERQKGKPVDHGPLFA